MPTGYMIEDGAPCPTRVNPDAVHSDLKRLMRRHGVTIRALANRMGVTMGRVRDARGEATLPYLNYCDFVQAVTGHNVFSRARYEAVRREKARRAALTRPE